MNTDYKVYITPHTEAQFRNIVDYLVEELQNSQAAREVVEDFEETVRRLSYTADGIAFCEDVDLRSRGYRIIRFRKHRYLAVFTIRDNVVYIMGIFHTLQDYENILH